MRFCGAFKAAKMINKDVEQMTHAKRVLPSKINISTCWAYTVMLSLHEEGTHTMSIAASLDHRSSMVQLRLLRWLSAQYQVAKCSAGLLQLLDSMLSCLVTRCWSPASFHAQMDAAEALDKSKVSDRRP